MRRRGAPANSLAAAQAASPVEWSVVRGQGSGVSGQGSVIVGLLDGPRRTGQDVRMPDKGPGSKGGAKNPKGGKAAATKNGKK
jgi:hypothetical protein